MSEREYLVALYAFVPFGPQRTKLLTNYFGSAKDVWNAKKSELIQVGLKHDLAVNFVSHRNEFNFNKYFDRLKRLNIGYITINDNDYPENLLDLSNAPIVLYYLGKLKPQDSNAVAIVGSRKMTSYGREVTERFSFELSQLGITIISGLALGIDAIAHKSALDAKGRSIAVLASGLDTISPVTNRWIADKIISNDLGAVISEYPLGVGAHRTHFANRNRIISGLSKAVLVVEGRRKSGTLLTASAAADQGRQVFAVPGQITSPMSEAPFFLIENGAKMALTPRDIIDELDLQLQVDKQAIEIVLPTSKEEVKILDFIANEAMHIDVIARELNVPIHKISSTLTSMELKGMVKSIGDGKYRVD